MSSTATISPYEEASSRHGWGVPDGYNIAACAFASSLITALVWAVDGSQVM
jgi:hypothetical protein